MTEDQKAYLDCVNKFGVMSDDECDMAYHLIMGMSEQDWQQVESTPIPFVYDTNGFIVTDVPNAQHFPEVEIQNG